jgi:hypothetical protein
MSDIGVECQVCEEQRDDGEAAAGPEHLEPAALPVPQQLHIRGDLQVLRHFRQVRVRTFLSTRNWIFLLFLLI